MNRLAVPRAFAVDETYDRDFASDRRSRFGAYLRQQVDMFEYGDGLTTDKCSFALTAWRIAQSPIMAPGYVRLHPRVVGTGEYWDDDQRVAIVVRVAAPLPAEVAGAIDVWRWHGWDQIGYPDPHWVEPYDNDRPAVFTVVTLRIPIPAAALPVPRYRAGAADTATAKQAIRVIHDLLNVQVGPVLAALDVHG